MRYFLFILLFVGLALAQSLTQIRSSESVAAEIERAQTQVLISAESIYSPEVADALRRTVVRGVRVRLLIDPSYAHDPNSFVPSLDALQWAFGEVHSGQERVAPYDPERFKIRAIRNVPNMVLIDNVVLVQGPFVSRASARFDDGKSYVSADVPLYQTRLSAFVAKWREAVPFESPMIRYITIE